MFSRNFRHLLFCVALVAVTVGSRAWGQQASAGAADKAASAQQDQQQDQSSAKPRTQAVDPLSRTPDPKRQKQQERAWKHEVSKVYKDWLEKDVTYIITDEEKSAFKQLSTDEERDTFIENFWY